MVKTVPVFCRHSLIRGAAGSGQAKRELLSELEERNKVEFTLPFHFTAFQKK